MQGRPRYATTALLCTFIAANAALAQGTTKSDSTQATAKSGTKACNTVADPTQALARATFSLQRAFQGIKSQRDPSRDLKDAIKALTTPPKDKSERGDSIGRAYYLGQAYILMLQAPGVKPVGRRGDYGIATDTVLSIDLLAAADTAFRKVETRMPECIPELSRWRQQKPWLDALNGAITAMNEGQYDSAEALAKRSLIIDRTTPYPYSILGNVASNRKDYVAATDFFKQVLTIAEKDTAYNDARLVAIFDIANTATQRANATTGPEKKALVQEAITDWHNFIPTVGSRDVQVANAEQLIVQLYKSLGDSSNIADAYAQIIANPAKFGEQTLLNAGVIATRARKPEDATTLFAAVLDQNPNQRDALNNLAASYVGKEPNKMFPLIDRLVTIDPDNPGNWMLYAYAYTGLLKGTKDPKLVKAYTDSLVKYNTKAEKMVTRVSLNEFSRGQQSTTLGGTIENTSATSKSYTMQIEFIDKAGTVLDTQTVNVGPVLSNDSGTFTAKTQVPNVTAFRYKILP